MHRINQRDRIINRRLWKNAVAEVEDVAGAAGGLREHLGGAAADFGAVGQEDAGVEVALYGAVEADRRQASSRRMRQSTPMMGQRTEDEGGRVVDDAPLASASSGINAGLPVAKLMIGTPGGRASIIDFVWGST